MPLENFNPDAADFYDNLTKFERFIASLFTMGSLWFKHPFKCYQTFVCGEIIIGYESLKRKRNKLYHQGILEQKDN